MITPVNSELKIVASEQLEQSIASDLESEQKEPLEELIAKNEKNTTTK